MEIADKAIKVFPRGCCVKIKKAGVTCCRYRHVIAVVAVLLSVYPGALVTAEDPLLLGVFPRRNPSEMVEMFTPLAEYLRQTLNRPVKLETTPDFNSFWEAVAAKRYHIVHYNQYHYVRSSRRLGYQLVAMNEEAGKSSIAGIVVARKDSGIRSLLDLRGRTILFGGNKHAMNSYVTPTYLLRQAGLKAGDYQEQFASNPPNVALAVFYKQAIAGGMGDILYDTPFISDKIDTSRLVTLAKSPAVPHLPWAVRGDVPAEVREQIRQVLLGVKQSANGEQILKAAALTNLVAVTDGQFDYVREMIANVMSEQY
jgi:phosphonate transport system substrate-binding protein